MKFFFQFCALFTTTCIFIFLTGCSDKSYPEPARTTPQTVRQLATTENKIIVYDINAQGLIAFLDGESYEYGNYQLVLVGKNGRSEKIKAEIAKAPLRNIKFSPDGRLLIGSNRGGIWIGEVEGDRLKRHVSTKGLKISSTEFVSSSPPYRIENGVLLSTSRSGNSSFKVARWKINDASFIDEKTFTLPREGSMTIASLRFSADGTKAVILWDDKEQNQHIERFPAGYIEIWDITKNRRLQKLEPIMPLGVEDPIFSPDTKYVAAVDSLGFGYIWNTQTGKLTQTLSGLRRRAEGRPDGYGVKFTSTLGSVANLIFMPDNRTVLAVINDGYILAYDVQSGLPVKILKKDAQYTYIKYSPNSHELLFVQEEQTIQEGQTLYALPLPEFANITNKESH